MINPRILREAENASTAVGNKHVASEQKLPRMKVKALGDVQNTLHSRPVNISNPNKNSVMKISSKSSISSVPVSNENASSIKNVMAGKIVDSTPTKTSRKLYLFPDNFESEIFETHNHKLCEEEQESHMNDYFKEYKFSDEQINNLIKSVKVFVKPLPVQVFEPCEDIEIHDENKFEENSFTLNDILSDLVLPQIPAPLEII